MTSDFYPSGEPALAGHDPILSAIHSLERALVSPAPGRQQEWASQVADDLRDVCAALARHREDVEKDDGLYEQLEDAMPRAAVRLQYLRETNVSLLEQAELLERQVERMAAGESAAFMSVRTQSLQLLSEMRQQQAREIDLVFEAFQRDTGEMD